MPVNSTPASPVDMPIDSNALFPISEMMCGWKMMAQTAARTIEMPSTGSAGIFFAIRMPVTSGTINVHKLMLNFEANVSV